MTANWARRAVTGLRRGLARADATLNALYGWRYNPLYQSGALAVALLVVLLVTGLYLLLFYRIAAPYESVARITEQAWAGRWVRGLHRYAADAAVVAMVAHALRLLLQRRSWGPRVLAWLSGLTLAVVLLVCGWTGYVMVWDVQAQVLAVEGARFLDVVPLFSEPISRAFVGDRPIPNAFFFLNLFLHVALPVGMGLVLWIHVARVARPTLLPPRRLTWGVVGLLFAVSVVWPLGMAAPADLFRLPAEAPFDVFYAFWLPLTLGLPAWAVWAGGGLIGVVLGLVPLWTRPARSARPAPSWVDERLCTGCEQCYLDCPYEAISMVARSDARPTLVARVDASLCVSCGICAGSCAPMGVGPTGRTGRDQLAAVKAFVAQRRPGALDVVVVACERGAGGNGDPRAGRREFMGAPVYGVSCAGSLHSSVIEYLVRAGAGGVLVAACPPRDCWNREGAAWLEQRIYHDREAELKARVDRRRVRLAYAAGAERGRLARELEALRAEVAELARIEAESDIDLISLCRVRENDEQEPGEFEDSPPQEVVA